jgi:ERO1-like protein alpha
LEKRAFYRLISGLHASINIHLSAIYLHKGILDQPDYWGPNLEEFQKRFDPKYTWGQGPQWLKNLYFIYLVELRAIAKAAPYLEKEIFYAGFSDKHDQETKAAVIDLLHIIR